MIPYKQRFAHRPWAGEFGDCHCTAIASVLEIGQDEIPNFGQHYDNVAQFEEAVNSWLAGQGLAQMHIPYDGNEQLDDVLYAIGMQNPGIYMLLGCTGKRGFGHTVVICDGKIVCDPFSGKPAEDLLEFGPMDDGFYWVTVLLPSVLKEKVG